jgi:hypothetical protein
VNLPAFTRFLVIRDNLGPSRIHLILFERGRDKTRARFIRAAPREGQFPVLPDDDIPAETG